MKRLFVILSLVIPIGLLLLFWLFPTLDPVWQVPLLHFYLVTFFTFAAAVVALLTAVTLGHTATPRHQLLATAFAVMGTLFFIHGITTPQAIIFTVHPGIRWAAWLTLFTGGLVFALAALDTPGRPMKRQQLRITHLALALFCGGFILITAFAPHWLMAVDEQAAPLHEQMVTAVTFLFWLFATICLTRTWRQTRNQVDGTMALIAAWFTIGVVSLHGFTVWQVSWWIYHFELLLGVITAVIILVLEYEQLRRFRLTYYYAATGLIITAAMALLASHLFSQMVEQNLASQLAGEALVTAVIRARLNGLFIAGLSMGLLYLLMLIVVYRADRLITVRNDELAHAYASLQAAETLRDDLTDMIVHDLRSPLTSINLSLSMIEKVLDDPVHQAERTRFFKNAHDSIQRMLGLISQLLDVARLEAGQLSLHRETVDLGTLLEERASFFASQAASGRKQIETNTPPDLPAVQIDADLVGRVLDNLIANALKYTTADGHVWLRASQNGEAYLVEVADDGEGIDPQAAVHVFDKFYQVKDGDGRPTRRGTGLGLTFCKLVVEAHHGRIWVDSSPGQGSTFAFTLPLTAH
jgi:signal transduction histidine kinase